MTVSPPVESRPFPTSVLAERLEGPSRPVLLLASLFPNRVNPLAGTFVAEPLRHVNGRYTFQAVSPFPWVPPVPLLPLRWRVLRRLPSKEEWGAVRVYHPRFLALPRAINYSLWGDSYYRACVAIANGLDFSLIHAHQLYPDGYAGLRLKRATGKPLVVTAHGELEVVLRSYPSIIPKVKRVLEEADRIVVVARYVIGLMQELGVEPDERVQVIPNGYDPALFYPRDRDQCRTAVGLPSVPIIMYVGNLYAPKGLPYLLEAVALLKEEQRDFLVVLVGGGVLDQALKEQARRLGIEPWVRFVGPKPREEVPLWMNAADVAVLPSVKEAFPTVLPELMACGRPVVASAVAGIPEIVSTPEVGLLVPPGNPEALAVTLAQGLERRWDPAPIAKHSQGYSYPVIANRLGALYDELIEGRG